MNNLSSYLRRRYYRFPAYYPPHDSGSEKREYASWDTARLDGKGELLTLQKIRDRSRDLFRNDAIGSAAVKKLVRSSLAGGLRFKSAIDVERLKISDKRADKFIMEIEDRFSEWCDAKNCDHKKVLDFNQIQELVAFNHLISGDCFFLLPVEMSKNENFNLSVNLIDTERVDTPPELEETEHLFYGVKTDKQGRIIGYYVSDRNPHSIFSDFAIDDFKFLPKYGRETGRQMVHHIFTSYRPDTYRGIPFLSPVIGKIKQLGRYTNAEVAAAIIGSYVVASIQRGSNTELGGGVPGLDKTSREPGVFEMGEGLVFESFDESTWNVHDSPKPNQNFEMFIRTMAQQIGASLEIPYEVLLNTFNSSYSASRASLLEAYRFFNSYARKIKDSFCNPIFKEWLTLEVQKGDIKLKGFLDDLLLRRAWCSCEWFGTSIGSIDPLKEAKAAEIRIGLGISTRTKESIEQTQSDFKKNSKMLEKEQMLLSFMSPVKNDGQAAEQKNNLPETEGTDGNSNKK